jgi:hypothetical protein
MRPTIKTATFTAVGVTFLVLALTHGHPAYWGISAAFFTLAAAGALKNRRARD